MDREEVYKVQAHEEDHIFQDRPEFLKGMSSQDIFIWLRSQDQKELNDVQDNDLIPVQDQGIRVSCMHQQEKADDKADLQADQVQYDKIQMFQKAPDRTSEHKVISYL